MEAQPTPSRLGFLMRPWTFPLIVLAAIPNTVVLLGVAALTVGIAYPFLCSDPACPTLEVPLTTVGLGTVLVGLLAIAANAPIIAYHRKDPVGIVASLLAASALSVLASVLITSWAILSQLS